MTTISIILVLMAGSSRTEIRDAAASCEIGQVIVGVPPRLSNVLAVEDLPAIVTETIETDWAWFTYVFPDEDPIEEYSEYEVSHTIDVEANVPCGE